MLLRAERAGSSLAELLLALTLTALVAAVLIGLLLAQLGLARITAQRAFAADATRTATHIIGSEVRRAQSGDVRAVSSDSLAMRLFRGMGIVCAAAGATLRVRYRGDRVPDADKDSVLLLPSARALALTHARPAPHASCTARAGETVFDLTLSRQQQGEAAALVFESGTYFLTSRALRYRLGAEGRQPLTAEVFAQSLTRFHAGPDGVLLQLTAEPPRAHIFNARHGRR
jgi:hypothetical protein